MIQQKNMTNKVGSDKDTSAFYAINFYTQMCVIQLRSIHLHSSTESHIQSMRRVIA